MLAIRMQRTGRKGHAQFRVVVQDARLTPSSGRVVARLGSYNPHSKAVVLDKEKTSFYLEHGAQPSERVVRVLKNEGIKLPKWVSLPADKTRTIRNAEKLRKNQPAEPAAKEETPQDEATPPEDETKATEEAPATNKADKKQESKEETSSEKTAEKDEPKE